MCKSDYGQGGVYDTVNVINWEMYRITGKGMNLDLCCFSVALG
jgi:hypothetical protein